MHGPARGGDPDHAMRCGPERARSRSPRCAGHLQLALLVSLALLAGHAGSAPATAGLPGPKAPASAAVGDEVRSVIARDGEARVLVAVGHPGIAGRGGRAGEAPVDRVLDEVGTQGLAVRRRFTHVSAFSAVVDRQGLERLARHPRIQRIDLDAGGQGWILESGPLAQFQVAQALGLRGEGARIAMLDTGIHAAHPDLGGAVVEEACFCSGGGGCCPNGSSTQLGLGAAQDDHGHGSNVAGVMISDGFVSPLGLSPDAELVSVKVLDHQASFCCSSDVVAGLDWLISNHPEIDAVNLSLGTSAIFPGDCDAATAFTLAYAQAVGTLRGMGIATIASSGNGGSGTSMSAPACVGDVLSVGAAWDAAVGAQFVFGCADASTAADQVTCYSNTGPTLDLVAAGNPMTSAGLGTNTSTFVGTSNAAPLASACIALVRGALPALSVDDLEAALEASPVLVTDATNGLSFPRIDCAAALAAVDFPPDVPAVPLAWLALVLGSAVVLGLTRPMR